jgi:DNA-directed RNA polymerase specialized sigma24 family protein
MNTTLPDLDTLLTMHDLGATTLYRIEVHTLAQVEGAERTPLYERARQGDTEARSALLFHCLEYLLAKAYLIYDERRPAHIDLMDLVGEANVFLLEHLDLALTKRDPIPYLFVMAVNHMERYCTYSAPLIQRPYGLRSEALARRQQYTSVESFDTPLAVGENDTLLLVDRIQAPAPTPATEQTEEYFHTRFSPLYEALERLAPGERRAIIQFYGLLNQPASTALELSNTWHVRSETVNANKRAGYRKLKKLLAGDLEQMLQWEQPGEEE